ncbi:FecR domain-containing protein [candidate division KSB1 bacterium]|nr:FecR domain-containing protein [candidate division KSB1 bacterium]
MIMIKSRLALCLLLVVLPAFEIVGQNAKEIALVIKVTGGAQIKSGADAWQPLVNGRRLNSGDIVKTEEGAFVAIAFTDDRSILKIRSKSQFQLEGERGELGIKKRLLMTIGQVWAKINPKGAGYRMVTPSGVAAVRGTEFYTIVDADAKMTVIGVTGAVSVFNKVDSVLVTPGKTGTVERGKAPLLTDTVDFVPWADDDETADSIDIEFQDANGVKKKLRLKYQK